MPRAAWDWWQRRTIEQLVRVEFRTDLIHGETVLLAPATLALLASPLLRGLGLPWFKSAPRRPIHAPLDRERRENRMGSGGFADSTIRLWFSVS